MVDALVIVGMAIVVLPLVSLVHELGHAIFALFLTTGYVSLTIGIDQRFCSFRIGRLEINVCRVFVLGGYTRYREPAFYRDHALILLAGPFFSLVFSIAALIVWVILPLEPINLSAGIFLLFLLFLFQFINTIVPKRYPEFPFRGMKSDGLLLKELKERHQYKNWWK